MSFIHHQNSKNKHIFKDQLTIYDFDVIKELGNGHFAHVYMSKYKYTGMFYAVKYIKQSNFKSQQRELDFLREKEILYDLTKRGYPHTVKLYADFQDDNFRYLVMELLEGTLLQDLGRTFQNNGHIEQKLIINILIQLLETLKYMHDTCHIMHRNIKPDNIILENNNNIKLIGFGLSAYLSHPKKQLVSNRSLKGHMQFLPNEVIFSPFPLNYDYKIDVFALGFTMFSIMNPLKGKKYNLPKRTLGKYGNLRREDNYSINNSYEKWLYEFLSLLFEDNQEKRLSASVALGFLKGLLTVPNLDELYNNTNIKQNNDISNVNLIFQNENENKQNNQNQLINSDRIKNNNQINNALPNNMARSSPVGINNMNSGISEVEEFLRPNMGNENRIKSSMKCLIYILYKLDIMNFIRSQLNQLFNNPQTNYSNLVLYSFNQMMNSLQQLENKQINNIYYDQFINNFITTIFNNNNSGVSGARPIILFYMISSICKKEYQQNFYNIHSNNIYDNIIKNNFFDFNTILDMNNPKIYISISEKIFFFKNRYQGIFVNNFYFLQLFLTRCPQCGKLFGIHGYEIGSFFQLKVPNQVNNINDLVNEYFAPKPETGDYNCKNCGCKRKKLIHKYCLNLPNYLFLELEDKNKIVFNDQFAVPLYNGKYYNYQFHACIFKRKINGIASFDAILKDGKAHFLYSDDRIDPYSSNIALDCPSLALYKRIAF